MFSAATLPVTARREGRWGVVRMCVICAPAAPVVAFAPMKNKWEQYAQALGQRSREDRVMVERSAGMRGEMMEFVRAVWCGGRHNRRMQAWGALREIEKGEVKERTGGNSEVGPAARRLRGSAVNVHESYVRQVFSVQPTSGEQMLVMYSVERTRAVYRFHAATR